MRRCVKHKSSVSTPKVTIMSEVQLCLKLCCSLTTEASLMKLHRKIKDDEKVCRAQDIGSYAHGQSHNQVRGRKIVIKYSLLSGAL